MGLVGLAPGLAQKVGLAPQPATLSEGQSLRFEDQSLRSENLNLRSYIVQGYLFIWFIHLFMLIHLFMENAHE